MLLSPHPFSLSEKGIILCVASSSPSPDPTHLHQPRTSFPCSSFSFLHRQLLPLCLSLHPWETSISQILKDSPLILGPLYVLSCLDNSLGRKTTTAVFMPLTHSFHWYLTYFSLSPYPMMSLNSSVKSQWGTTHYKTKWCFRSFSWNFLFC